MWTQTSPVNWKSVRDVDNEGYHVAMAHPALQDLYGPTYFDEPFVNGVCRSFATYNPHAGRRPSVRAYRELAPKPGTCRTNSGRPGSITGCSPTR